MDIVERLKRIAKANFDANKRAGRKGPEWALRNEVTQVAADTITALRARCASLEAERDEARATDAENLEYIETMRTRLAEAKASRDLQATIAADEETRARRAEATIEKLQAALAFWMPGVSEAIEIELNGRAGDDAYLLAGFNGEVPPESWGDKTLARATRAEAMCADLAKALEFYACDAPACDCMPGREEAESVSCGFKARLALATYRKGAPHE